MVPVHPEFLLAWRVGVAHPMEPDEVLFELEVSEGAISTSAAYEKRFEFEGKHYGHVLDPRTGKPVGRSLGVTIWTERALEGDVASTALFVLGPEEGPGVLEKFAPTSALFLQQDSSAWGGLRSELLHFPTDSPGFRLLPK